VDREASVLDIHFYYLKKVLELAVDREASVLDIHFYYLKKGQELCIKRPVLLPQ